MVFHAVPLRHGDRAPWDRITHVRLTGLRADTEQGNECSIISRRGSTTRGLHRLGWLPLDSLLGSGQSRHFRLCGSTFGIWRTDAMQAPASRTKGCSNLAGVSDARARYVSAAAQRCDPGACAPCTISVVSPTMTLADILSGFGGAPMIGQFMTRRLRGNAAGAPLGRASDRRTAPCFRRH